MSEIDCRIDEKFRNKVGDITIGSVWQFLSSTKLLVVTALEDDCLAIEYIDGNNGMKRSATMDIEHFLSFYRLFYSTRPNVNSDFYSVADDKNVALEGLIAAAKDIRDAYQTHSESNEQGEIYYADRMSDPVNDLIAALNYLEEQGE